MLIDGAVKVQPLGVALGAEVQDVDLRRLVSPSVAEQLRLMLDEHL